MSFLANSCSDCISKHIVSTLKFERFTTVGLAAELGKNKSEQNKTCTAADSLQWSVNGLLGSNMGSQQERAERALMAEQNITKPGRKF